MGKRRRRKARKAPWKILGGFFHLLTQGILKALPLLVVGGVAGGIFWGLREKLYADPGFRVETLEVIPEEGLGEGRIRQLERRYLGKNLFRVSPEEVSHWIERDPKVWQGRVSRDFPRTLRIEILDRKPVAQIQFSPQGPYFWVGEDGVIVALESHRHDTLLWMEAFGLDSPRLERGERLELAGFKEALYLIKVIQHHPRSSLYDVERVRIDRWGNVTLVLRHGAELRFGPRPLQKTGFLDSLVPLLEGEGRQIVYIELSEQNLIVKRRER